MTDINHYNQAFPPLDTICKQRFAFTLACFIAEWGLRRRKGLP